MSIRDSGIIDLFAIHQEENQRAAEAAPSAPPPGVALDVDAGDVEPEAFAALEAQRRRRTKIVGGVLGGLTVLGILVAAITSTGAPAPAKAAAAAPPPPAVAVPPPAETAPPAPPAKDPPTVKPEYTPASAAAAYAAAQPKKKGHGGKGKAGGPKLQKVQSGGI